MTPREILEHGDVADALTDYRTEAAARFTAEDLHAEHTFGSYCSATRLGDCADYQRAAAREHAAAELLVEAILRVAHGHT